MENGLGIYEIVDISYSQKAINYWEAKLHNRFPELLRKLHLYAFKSKVKQILIEMKYL